MGRLPSWLLSVAVTHDDALIIGASLHQTVVWDAHDARAVQQLPGARRVALIPNGHERERELLLAYDDVRIVVLDGGPARELQGGGGPPIAVSADGRWLAASRGSSVLVVEATSGEQRVLETDHDDAVSGLAFASDTCLYVAHTYEAHAPPRTSIDRWHLDDTPRRERLDTGPQFYDAFVAVSPDGERFAVKMRYYDRNCDIALFDRQGSQVANIGTHDNAYSYVAAFSPDGKRLALMKQSSISLWDATDGRQLGIIDALRNHTRSAVAFCRASE